MPMPNQGVDQTDYPLVRSAGIQPCDLPISATCLAMDSASFLALPAAPPCLVSDTPCNPAPAAADVARWPAAAPTPAVSAMPGILPLSALASKLCTRRGAPPAGLYSN